MRRSKQTVMDLSAADSINWQSWSEKWGSWDNWFRPKAKTTAAAASATGSRLRKLLQPPFAIINRPLRKSYARKTGA